MLAGAGGWAMGRRSIRRKAVRALTSWRQVPTTWSIGVKARPSRNIPANMMPPVASRLMEDIDAGAEERGGQKVRAAASDRLPQLVMIVRASRSSGGDMVTLLAPVT